LNGRVIWDVDAEPFCLVGGEMDPILCAPFVYGREHVFHVGKSAGQEREVVCIEYAMQWDLGKEIR